MPISSELRRVKIGLFHPVLIKILTTTKNKKRSQVGYEGTASKVFSVFAMGLLHGLYVSLPGDNDLHCEFSAVNEMCLVV